MFENIAKFFKKLGKKEPEELSSRDMAKERLQLVLMQDRANVSADFLDMMKQEIIEVIKKYIDVEEKDIDVRLTNKINEDGTTGAPALYANIPISGIKQEVRGIKNNKEDNQSEEKENKSDDSEENNAIIDDTLKPEKESTEIEENATAEVEDKEPEEIAKKEDEEDKEVDKVKEDNKNNNSAKNEKNEEPEINEKKSDSEEKDNKELKKETVTTADKK